MAEQPDSELMATQIVRAIGVRKVFRMGDEDVAVGPGYVFTVPARVEHRFHSIEEDLLMLVFFAPPEGSASGGE